MLNVNHDNKELKKIKSGRITTAFYLNKSKEIGAVYSKIS